MCFFGSFYDFLVDQDHFIKSKILEFQLATLFGIGLYSLNPLIWTQKFVISTYVVVPIFLSAQYGRPISDWKKETGRRLAADFYKRKLPGKSAEAPKPIVSTKGATFGGELKELPVIQPVTHAKHDDSCCGGTGGSCGCSN